MQKSEDAYRGLTSSRASLERLTSLGLFNSGFSLLVLLCYLCAPLCILCVCNSGSACFLVFTIGFPWLSAGDGNKIVLLELVMYYFLDMPLLPEVLEQPSRTNCHITWARLWSACQTGFAATVHCLSAAMISCAGLQ